METTTTLTLKDIKRGTSAHGAWAFLFFDCGYCVYYTTLDGAVASAAQALAGQLITVEYTEKPPKAGKEQYGPTYGLDGVSAAAEGATPAPVAQAPAAQSGGKGEFRSPAQIIRTTAIEVAASAFLSLGLNPVEDTVGVLTYAGLVETFITEGIEEEPEA